MIDFDILNESREEDEKYLNFIRQQPCIICQGARGISVPHHVFVGGMGTKCSDYFTIPLCSYHHTNGKEAIHKIGKKRFEHYFNRNIECDIIFFLSKYIREGNNGRN